MDEPLIGPLDPDPAVYETGRWRGPRRLARVFSGARRAQGLFDPDRGPSPVPGTVLLAAAADPAPTALTPLVQHTAPPREHDIGLPVPAVPACPGHERVIRELKEQLRRLDAENWRLRRRLQAGHSDEHDGNGSTTSAGRPSSTPSASGHGEGPDDPLRLGTADLPPGQVAGVQSDRVGDGAVREPGRQ